MKTPIYRNHWAATALAALVSVALPAAAAADKEYADALEREAGQTGVVQYPSELAIGRSGPVAEDVERALVEELRSYYPASYRAFRGLTEQQVEQLVAVFAERADIIAVLKEMDRMLPE